MEIPRGYCHCGCGGKTTLITENDVSTNSVKGEYRRYIQHHCRKQTKDEYLSKFWSKVSIKSPDDCWEWNGTKLKAGYGKYHCYGQARNEFAHRISYTLTNGDIPYKMCVCHKCDNPSCVNPHHLFIGTYLDNMQDMKNKGRKVPIKGENNHRAKISESDVHEIRRLKTAKYKTSVICKMFQIAESTARGIINRSAWSHVP